MKLFIVKIISFCTILVLCVNSTDYLIPYYWGNPQCASKIRYLSAHENAFNTVFVGSSRIYRQLDPTLFDQNTVVPTTSFNLGCSRTFTPESYFLYKHMLDEGELTNIKYAIMELQIVTPIADSNLSAIESQYYLDNEEFSFAVNAIVGSKELSVKRRARVLLNYLSGYLHKRLGINTLRSKFELLLDPEDWVTDVELPLLAQATNGYYSLDKEMYAQGGELIERFQTFHADPTELEQRKRSAQKIYATADTLSPNLVVLARSQQLIALSEAQNIQLIFVLPPRLQADYFRELVPTFLAIDPTHRIDLGNPLRFEAFYQTENSFDVGHLNENGAHLLTTALANQFNTLARTASK